MLAVLGLRQVEINSIRLSWRDLVLSKRLLTVSEYSKQRNSFMITARVFHKNRFPGHYCFNISIGIVFTMISRKPTKCNYNNNRG